MWRARVANARRAPSHHLATVLAGAGAAADVAAGIAAIDAAATTAPWNHILH